MRTLFGLTLAACCVWQPVSGAARAASRTLEAGAVLGVGEDIVLKGDDVLEVNGTREKPCRIDANAQQIRTAEGWRGRVRVRFCEFRGLGSAKKPALDITATGDGDRVVIDGLQRAKPGIKVTAKPGRIVASTPDNSVNQADYTPASSATIVDEAR